nr:reeler domain-containing protein [Acinetobacter baumannii]MBO0619159.1 hypothetical protein [Acinetobacter baumannii]
MKVLIGVFLLACNCYAYPTGAPPAACKSLIPTHRVIVDGRPTSDVYQPQTGESPYKLTAVVNSDSSVTLTLSGEVFKGFVFRSFDENDDPINGQFVSGRGLRTLNCDSYRDTITHRNPRGKSNLNLVWHPPSGYEGTVIFRGSVVKNYSTFWKVKSEPIQL